jgi:hypothetical protein
MCSAFAPHFLHFVASANDSSGMAQEHSGANNGWCAMQKLCWVCPFNGLSCDNLHGAPMAKPAESLNSANFHWTGCATHQMATTWNTDMTKSSKILQTVSCCVHTRLLCVMGLEKVGTCYKQVAILLQSLVINLH